MSSEIREALVTAGVCTGIAYTAFLIGWIFRDHLGVPKENLKSLWVLLLVVPLTAGVLLVTQASLPPDTRGIFVATVGVVLLWGERRYYRWLGRQQGVGGRDSAQGGR